MVVFGALAVVVAAIVKGVIGTGFPTLATPLLTLFLDVKTAFVLLIVPNIVMDAVQLTRRGSILPTLRRFAVLLAFGAVGMVIGTRLFVALSPRVLMLVLGAFILVFVGLNATRVSPRLPREWEPWMSPVVGFVAGVVGGITNVPGTPLVIYFYALGLAKHDFVRSVAVTFIVYKLVQLAAVTWYGLLTLPLLGVSFLLTAVALGGFFVGLAVQDRLEQRAFNRAVLVFLAALGLWLTARGVL
jgi:uncharacterized membrane protein YfcA